MSDEPTVSIEQAIATQRALRDELGLGEERFPMPAFVGMLSDEIEKPRAAGHDDAAIAKMISRAAGVELGPETIARFYAPPEKRRRG